MHRLLLEEIKVKHGEVDFQLFVDILDSLEIQATDGFWFINEHTIHSSVVTNLLNKIKSVNDKEKKESIKKIVDEENRQKMKRQFDNYRKTMNLHTLLVMNHEKCLAFHDSSPFIKHIEKDIEHFLKKLST